MDDAVRDYLLHLVRDAPPDDLAFWSLLVQAEALADSSDDLVKHLRRLLRSAGAPRDWLKAATSVVAVRDHVRRLAEQHLRAWSRKHETDWKHGHEHGLVEMVRDDGVQEPWVQHAIAQLRAQQHAELPAMRRSATAILTAVGKALPYLGKGQISDREAEDRRAAELARPRRHKALRGLERAHAKNLKWHGEDAAVAYQQTVADFLEKSRLSKADKDAVLGEFKKRHAPHRGGTQKAPLLA